MLALAIYRDGSELIANGYADVRCPSSPHAGAGGNVRLIGEVDADGTFTLHPRSGHGSIELAITGKMPAEGASAWEGRYTLTGATGGSGACKFDQGAAFTASPLAPLAGEFHGALMLGNTGRKFEFTVAVEQGDFKTHERKALPIDKFLPLFGTIDVSGVPCFTQGKSDGTPFNRLEGDSAELHFTMDDGAEISMHGLFSNEKESSILVNILVVRGGKCDRQTYGGTLERK